MFAAKDALLTRPSGGYVIPRSLRFRSSASASMNRTFAAGNQKTFTWSAWVKRGTLGVYGGIFGPSRASPDQIDLRWQSDNTLLFYVQVSAASQCYLQTVRVFRDPSAWYHLVLKVDTTQATAANRTIWYVNGVAETAYTGVTYPGLNADISGWNTTSVNYISTGNSGVTDQTLADVYFIDGQALTPTSFGATNATTGVWAPIKYTGTYGTNGFHLDFNSYATTAALGTDTSGNGNTWTVNNVSVTAGVTYDSMIDVPTVGTTGSNYPTWNAIRGDIGSGLTLSSGNLKASASVAGTYGVTSTITVDTQSSGGFYMEYNVTQIDFATPSNFGLVLPTVSMSAANLTTVSGAYVYNDSGTTAANGSAGTTYTAVSTGGVIAIAVRNGKVYVAINNTFVNSGNPVAETGSVFSGLTGLYNFYYQYTRGGGGSNVNTIDVNFGQRPFAYTPPSGYSALNTYNLPTPTILKGNTVMDATLYTGTGASLSVTNAAGFQPDFVWVKGRSGATDHAWYDSVRGVQKQIESNTATAETTETTGLTAFGSGGFTVGALAQMNTSAATYVGWQWKGSGTTVSNTTGSITSTVCVNPTAGFSVLTYTGTGVTATIGHSLGVVPSMVITKNKSSSTSWRVYHAFSNATPQNYVLYLEGVSAATAESAFMNNTAPTSTVFTAGTNICGSASVFVSYCFAPIAGYSAFGSYTGNGSADGPFVFTGFRPRWIMLKNITTGGGGYDWFIFDTARDTYNVAVKELEANLSIAEDQYGTSSTGLDSLSNGFKLRISGAGFNESGSTFVYAAFAESPFKNSLAR